MAISGFVFYWFQIRLTVIKKNCSWITYIVPADPGVTKEQADFNKKALDQCNSQPPPNNGIKMFCYQKDIEERPPKSEKEVVREATKDEYDLCLRRQGL